MARFRKKNYSATGFARASYSEVYDMHTEFGKTTMIGVHTPTTTRWQYFLEGFVKQYKKFRYKGASLTFVPVATLPADPLQVSYEAGETIDPRDLMNPIIHCGMRGESMGNYLDEIFNMNISHALNSLDVADIASTDTLQKLENAYYSALMSPTFRKSHPQQGFRKSGLHPMVYQMTTNMPFNYASSEDSYTIGYDDDSLPTMGVRNDASSFVGDASDNIVRPETQSLNNGVLASMHFKDELLSGTHNEYLSGQFFTNKLTSLGWLDTLQRFTAVQMAGTNFSSTSNRFTTLPKVYMYFIMLPPAYKTEMYYRVIVRHYFEFKGFRTTSQPFAWNSGIEGVYDGVIENNPVATTSEASMASELPVASVDIYNGEASLVSDGAM